MDAALTLSEHVGVLLATYVGIEAEQHRIGSADPTGRDKTISAQMAALAETALAVIKEVEAIDDISGNADLAATLILLETMLLHDYAQLGSVEWGEDDRLNLKVLAALAGSTTGEVRRHTAAVLATIGIIVPDEHDAFLTALRRYQAENDAFLALSDDVENEVLDAASEAMLDKLFAGKDRTPPPCTSMAGAIAGIRQVFAERPFCDQVAEKLLCAVLTFLEGTTPAVQPDPLATLIAAFNADVAADARLSDDEADAVWKANGGTYGPAFQRLRDDPPAATTMAGVGAALQLMVDEKAKGNDWLEHGFLGRAVLPFFERRT